MMMNICRFSNGEVAQMIEWVEGNVKVDVPRGFSGGSARLGDHGGNQRNEEAVSSSAELLH